jgi:hypothetical protein
MRPQVLNIYTSLNYNSNHSNYLLGNHKRLSDIENPEDRTKLILVDHINKGRGNNTIL